MLKTDALPCTKGNLTIVFSHFTRAGVPNPWIMTLFGTGPQRCHISTCAHMKIPLCEQGPLVLAGKTLFVRVAGAPAHRSHKWSCTRSPLPTTHKELSPLSPQPGHQARKFGNCCTRAPLSNRFMSWDKNSQNSQPKDQ